MLENTYSLNHSNLKLFLAVVQFFNNRNFEWQLRGERKDRVDGEDRGKERRHRNEREERTKRDMLLGKREGRERKDRGKIEA